LRKSRAREKMGTSCSVEGKVDSNEKDVGGHTIVGKSLEKEGDGTTVNQVSAIEKEVALYTWRENWKGNHSERGKWKGECNTGVP